MNGAEAMRRIWRERQEWRQAGSGAEISWTVRGIEIGLRVVRQLSKEERSQATLRRPRLSRWLAGDLYQAIKQALDYLKRGDRAKGIQTLEKALERVKVAKQGAA